MSETTPPMTVAAAQYAPVADAAENRRLLAEQAARAGDRGAALLVAPEYASYFDGAPSAAAVAAAEPLDGPFAEALRESARQRSMTIVAGLVERTEAGDRFRNALLAAGPDGELAAVYRKVHLYDAFGSTESEFVEPGDPRQDAPVIEAGGLRVGLQTCYDLRFPESTRRLADAGAELIAVPAQWVRGPLKERHWATLIAARAIETTAAVVAADHPAPSGVGLSRVVGPDGETLAGAGAGPALAVAEIDPAAIAAARRTNPCLELRRYRVIPADDSEG